LQGMVESKYVSSSNPFKGLSKEQISELAEHLSRENKLEFAKIIDELKDYIKPFDLLSLVSWFSYYCLTAPPGTNPEWERKDVVLQHHVEILQALKLQESLEEIDQWKPLLPENTQTINDLLRRLSLAFCFQRLEFKDDEIEQKKFAIIEGLRNHTMAVRNWGFAKQIIRIVEDIYKPIDEEIKSETGLSVLSLIKMGVKLINKIEDRINEHREHSIKILFSKTATELVDTYLTSYPFVNSSREEMLKLRGKFRSLQDFKYSLISHSDLFLRDYYSLKLDDFIEAYEGEVDPKTLEALLDNCSITYGELKDYPTDHIFLNNPIWDRPLVKVGDKEYAWPIPGLFLHACIPLMESVFSNSLKLKEKYQKRRGKFLEEDIERLFHASFKEAKIFRNLKWESEDGGKAYENDLLVIIDSFAIVVEAKGGKISAPARRGAPDRLKREIQDLIVDPAKQARRFARHLENNLTKLVLKNDLNEEVEVDLSKVKRVITLSVTLELFGDIQAQFKELRQAGLIETKDVSPCMSLADLEIVLDLLETSCEKVHYLARRSEFEQNANYLADEMDLLVFYLQTGFNIGESEFNGQPLMLSGASRELEPYYLVKLDLHDLAESSTVQKPRSRRTQWWHDIITKLDSRKVPGWTEIAYTLLNVSFDDQKKFERGFEKVKRETNVRWQKEGHLNSLILFNGPPQRKEIVIAFAYKNVDKETRNNRMKNAAIEAVENVNLETALVIGMDGVYPYSVLATFRINDKLLEGTKDN